MMIFSLVSYYSSIEDELFSLYTLRDDLPRKFRKWVNSLNKP